MSRNFKEDGSILRRRLRQAVQAAVIIPAVALAADANIPHHHEGKVTIGQRENFASEPYFNTIEERRIESNRRDARIFPDLIQNDRWKATSWDEVLEKRRERLPETRLVRVEITGEAYRALSQTLAGRSPTEFLQTSLDVLRQEAQKGSFLGTKIPSVTVEVWRENDVIIGDQPQLYGPNRYSDPSSNHFYPTDSKLGTPRPPLSVDIDGQYSNRPQPITATLGIEDTDKGKVAVDFALDVFAKGLLGLDVLSGPYYNLPEKYRDILPHIRFFSNDIMGDSDSLHFSPASMLQAELNLANGFRSLQAEGGKAEAFGGSSYPRGEVRFSFVDKNNQPMDTKNNKYFAHTTGAGNVDLTPLSASSENNNVRINKNSFPTGWSWASLISLAVNMKQEDGSQTFFPFPSRLTAMTSALGQENPEFTVRFVKPQVTGEGVDIKTYREDEVGDIKEFLQRNSDVFAYTTLPYTKPAGEIGIIFAMWSSFKV